MDAIRVPEGVKKITIIPDEKVPSAATFKLAREDHTMANLLRMCVRSTCCCGASYCAHNTQTPPPTQTHTHAYPPTHGRELLRDFARVKFAGYKHPHPLDNDILLRIQSAVGVTPATTLTDAAKRLEDEYRTLLTQFERQVAEHTREAERL